MGEAHHGCADEKSAAIVWRHRADVNPNEECLWKPVKLMHGDQQQCYEGVTDKLCLRVYKTWISDCSEFLSLEWWFFYFARRQTSSVLEQQVLGSYRGSYLLYIPTRIETERKVSCTDRASICTSSMTLEEELLEARAEQRALEMAEELKTKYDQLKEFRHANMLI